MQILIADSGSTKTDWLLSGPGNESTLLLTQGLNPWYLNPDQLLEALRSELLPQLDEDPAAVYFYGAGCAGEEQSRRMHRALERALPRTADIQVHSDMLGAARSLCGRSAGIACVLGTGSNSCLYDGRNIERTQPNLGFWLGDEGSGAYLGKRLIQDFFNQEMPGIISLDFENRYGLKRDAVIERLYRNSFPNRYAAAFAKFLHDHINNEYCAAIVEESFSLFLKRSVMRYPEAGTLPLHFCGSIAFHFADVLKRVAGEKGLEVASVVRSPGEGLEKYHLAAVTEP
ncbi:MAG: N-acetylglucosamine kinase [Bacteroidota bacterium]